MCDRQSRKRFSKELHALSYGKAAEILDMDKTSFITDLGKIGIPYFDGEINEVVEDARNIKKSFMQK
jgi:hypothetical protein